jgi:CHRD domain-containing protein
MRKRITIAAAAIFAVAIAGTAVAFNDNGGRRFFEFLTGFKEAPQIVHTSGTGTFRATINREGTGIDYVLTFQNLESNITQAHIHLGWPQSNGNIVLWLCDSDPAPASPVATTPLCSQNSQPGDLRNGRVEGTLSAADVIPQAANGIAGPADFDDVLDLIRRGHSYVNIHTVVIGAGEIRSQIDNRGGDHGHDRH